MMVVIFATVAGIAKTALGVGSGLTLVLDL